MESNSIEKPTTTMTRRTQIEKSSLCQHPPKMKKFQLWHFPTENTGLVAVEFRVDEVDADVENCKVVAGVDEDDEVVCQINLDFREVGAEDKDVVVDEDVVVDVDVAVDEDVEVDGQTRVSGGLAPGHMCVTLDGTGITTHGEVLKLTVNEDKQKMIL